MSEEPGRPPPSFLPVVWAGIVAAVFAAIAPLAWES